MTNVNETVSRRVDTMMETIKTTKAVNVSSVRDSISEDTRPVFEAMKERLEQDGLNYGASESDGRFWIKD